MQEYPNFCKLGMNCKLGILILNLIFNGYFFYFYRFFVIFCVLFYLECTFKFLFL